MISVIASRHHQSGEVLIEKIVDWAPFHFPEDRQEAVEEVLISLQIHYGEERQVICDHVPNLLSFFQKHPNFVPKATPSKESNPQ